MMIKTIFSSCALLLSMQVQANSNNSEHFIDRNQDLIVHHIFCGNPQQLASLKPAFIFNNSPQIQDGRYSFNSAFGQFSYQMSAIPGQAEFVKQRQLFTPGSDVASQTDVCLVQADASLPAAFQQQIKQVTIASDDEANYSKQLEQYAMVAGRPAFSAGNFDEPKANAKLAEYDVAFYENNQQILADLEQRFDEQSQLHQQQLIVSFKEAVAYAKQEDGAVNGKQYEKIEEPLVWTTISKERYEDALFRQNNEIAYDRLMQDNYDWLFAQVGKDSQLVRSEISQVQPAEWFELHRQQQVTLSNYFDNGKVLNLTFIIKSQSVPAALFESLQQIAEKSNNKRKSLDIKRNEPRAMLQPFAEFLVNPPENKINLFFSEFRSNQDRWTVSDS